MQCGAAAVVGFMSVLAKLQPPGLRVSAIIPCVRNSIGSNAYIPDEIITSRSGMRVLIGNTDAEVPPLIGVTIHGNNECCLFLVWRFDGTNEGLGTYGAQRLLDQAV